MKDDITLFSPETIVDVADFSHLMVFSYKVFIIQNIYYVYNQSEYSFIERIDNILFEKDSLFVQIKIKSIHVFLEYLCE